MLFVVVFWTGLVVSSCSKKPALKGIPAVKASTDTLKEYGFLRVGTPISTGTTTDNRYVDVTPPTEVEIKGQEPKSKEPDRLSTSPLPSTAYYGKVSKKIIEQGKRVDEEIREYEKAKLKKEMLRKALEFKAKLDEEIKRREMERKGKTIQKWVLGAILLFFFIYFYIYVIKARKKTSERR